MAIAIPASVPAPRILALAFALVLGCHAGAAAAGNGDPANGYPSYRERAILTLVNACRQDPIAYRNAYLGVSNILTPSAYPPVRPVYWTLPLNESARAHSIDMATTPCFQHNSCDGTDVFVRIMSYYNQNTYWGENIAGGYDSPAAVMSAWLLDGGAADLSGGDGHRRNIMSANFLEMGNGCATGGPYGTYYTQDLGGGSPDFSTPLVSGSHAFMGDGKTTFLAAYFSPSLSAPVEATLVLDDVAYSMPLAFGTPSNGTYALAVSPASTCRRYRFRFRDGAGNTWLHPESGYLFTTGEGNCPSEYEGIATDVVTGADESHPRLSVPVPNPATEKVTFTLSVPDGVTASVRVLDVSGREVRSLAVTQGLGVRHSTWDGRDERGFRVAKGVFSVRLETSMGVSQQRLVFLGSSK